VATDYPENRAAAGVRSWYACAPEAVSGPGAVRKAAGRAAPAQSHVILPCPAYSKGHTDTHATHRLAQALPCQDSSTFRALGPVLPAYKGLDLLGRPGSVAILSTVTVRGV